MSEPLNSPAEEWRLRELLSEAERQLGPKHPEVALRLMKLGSHLVSHHRVEDARECFARAVELLEKSNAEFQADLADACFSISGCYSRSCNWDEAFPWLERAVTLSRAARGTDDEDTFTMELEMVILLNCRWEHAEAAALAKPLLVRAEHLFGDETPRTVRVLFELAVALDGDK